MGSRNHANHSKNQRIVNIFKQKPLEYWRREVQGADPHSQNQIPQALPGLGSEWWGH